tara:strand:- start:1052 stop:1750 length:699 start_codon:yes stop_codon:yes gene_type:complete
MVDSTKSSNLNLFNKNDLSEKTFFLDCGNNGTEIQSNHKLNITTDNFSITNNNPNYTFDHLGKWIYDNNIYVLSRLNTNNENIIDNTTRLNTEIVDRIAQGSALNSLIINEIQRATLRENEVNNSLIQEVADRKLAIDNERNNRITNDNNNFTILNTLITTEKTTRENNVTALNTRLDDLLVGTDVDLDQLHEIITAYQNADTQILQTMSDTIDRLTELETRFNHVFETQNV